MAIFNFLGNLALIPAYGINGAAATTFFSYLLGMLLLFYYSRKVIKFEAPLPPILKTTCGGVLTLLLIFGLKRIIEMPPWPEAFLVIAVSFLFYSWWVLTTGALTKEDLKLVARITPIPKWLLKIAKKIMGE
jgi:O-antigen/teichoic acid export membrane protein